MQNQKEKKLTGNVRIYSGKQECEKAYFGHRPLSMVETTEVGFGMLYYQNGSNRGDVMLMKIEKEDFGHSIYHGLRYWKWNLLGGRDLDLEEWEIKDFCVLLPKRSIEVMEGEYTMVTKEWSPIMLEHYDYCKVGLDVEKEVKIEYSLVI